MNLRWLLEKVAGHFGVDTEWPEVLQREEINGEGQNIDKSRTTLGTSCTFSVKSLDNSFAFFRVNTGCRVIGTGFTMDTVEERQIRAAFDDKTIRVYQAYSHEIADSALKHGTFVSPPFSMNRMTWIKPSFLWMMYRSGWATKSGRERILAIDITHVGFEWALDHAILSTYNPELHKSQNIWQAQLQSAPVRLQWDPDRDIHLRKMARRAVQIGLAGDALRRYVNEWITKITDITPDVHVIREVVSKGHDDDIKKRLPVEEVYSINQCLRQPQIT